MKDCLRRILTLLLTAVFVVSCTVTVSKLAQYGSADRENEKAEETAGTDIPTPPQEQEAPEEPEEPVTDPLADDPYAAQLREIDFSALKAVNEEVIGWILIPGTELNYPLLQTTNNEYYLTHTWQKNYNSGGSIFMEQLCASDFSDFNTIIYGHRMNNDSMFGCMKYYKEDSFRQEHPMVYIATPEHIYQYEIFASLEPGITEATYRLKIASDEQKQAFLDFTMSRTVIDTGIVPTTEDRILTMSTCTGHGHATRWVVQARLLHETAMELPQETAEALPGTAETEPSP